MLAYPQNSLNRFDEKERVVEYKTSNIENFVYDREVNWRNRNQTGGVSGKEVMRQMDELKIGASGAR